MEMTGEYRIAAPRQKIWEALNDPEVLKQCIPGCETLDKTSPTSFEAKVVTRIGPVKAGFTGAVTLSDLDPPKGYKISGEGKGGAAGFARGGAEVNLEEVDPHTTILRYKATANVGGKLAQIGSRLIEGTAKKLSDDFFGGFARLVAAAEPVGATAAGPVAEPSAAAALAPAAATPAKKAGLSPMIWIAGVVVVVIALLVIFAR
jgi:carbon monoxide dehydrogenase subunit G